MKTAIFNVIRDCLLAGSPAALATVISVESTKTYLDPKVARGGGILSVTLPPLGAALVVRPGKAIVGSLGNPALDDLVSRDALEALEVGQSVLRHYGGRGQSRLEPLTVFIQSLTPPRRMLIFGATDFTTALVRVAKILGYRVTVCDARVIFATVERFPEADEVVVDWPHRYLTRITGDLSARDAICVLSHDKKFDVPAILAALGTPVGYVGVMGSRRTIAERFEQLRAKGVGEKGIQRVMAPIGLDIGARTPEETAVAIMAEIIAGVAQCPAPSLRDQSGPIHRSER